MQQLQTPYMLILYGPTGVGKTAYARELANHLPIEIINMDVGQFYTPCSIGTAKPDWRKSTIVHHLFDIVNEPCNFSVMAYRNRVQQCIKQIWDRNRLPVCVGGSGFYLKSLFFPPKALPLQADNNAARYADRTTISLWHELYDIDPKRAHAIHSHDRYRIIQALVIWHKTGKKPSTCKPVYEPLAPFSLIFLTREREQLYQRINDRVHAMINQGWLEEVQQLLGTKWEPFLTQKNLIGYPELFSYLRNKYSFEEAIQRIQQRTRNYAKRQYTFWSSLQQYLVTEQAAQQRDTHEPKSHIEIYNLTKTTYSQYSIQLLHRLKKLFVGHKS